MTLWTPAQTDITGLASWHDASDGASLTTAGGAVSQWNDKSGNGNHVSQPTASQQPTVSTAALNSLDVLSFNSANVQCLGSGQLAGYSGNNVTVFLVAKPNNASQNAVLDCTDTFGTVNRTFRGVFESNQVRWRTGTGSSGYAYSPGATHVFSAVINTTGKISYQDGTLKLNAAATTASMAANRLRIGGFTNGTYAYPGTIAEIVIYQGQLSDADRQKVEGYLAWKWGLQGQLDASHSYLSAAPTVSSGGSTDGTASGASLSATATLDAGMASGTVSATTSGVTLAAAANLAAGSATGAQSGTAAGASLTGTASLSAGGAAGIQSPTVAGQSISATAALSGGSASGAAQGTASGAGLTASAAVLAGSASGTISATAPAADLAASADIVAGGASGSVNVTASGGILSATASLLAGAANGTVADNAVASGVTLSTAASLAAGSASGTINATAPSAMITATASLSAGGATVRKDATASGANLTATVAMSAGSALGVIVANGTASGAMLTSATSLSAGNAIGTRTATAPGITLSVDVSIFAGMAGHSSRWPLHASINGRPRSTSVIGRAGRTPISGRPSSQKI